MGRRTNKDRSGPVDLDYLNSLLEQIKSLESEIESLKLRSALLEEEKKGESIEKLAHLARVTELEELLLWEERKWEAKGRRVRVWTLTPGCSGCGRKTTTYVSFFTGGGGPSRVYFGTDYDSLMNLLKKHGFYIKRRQFQETPPKIETPYEGEWSTNDLYSMPIPEGVPDDLLEPSSGAPDGESSQ